MKRKKRVIQRLGHGAFLNVKRLGYTGQGLEEEPQGGWVGSQRVVMIWRSRKEGSVASHTASRPGVDDGD